MWTMIHLERRSAGGQLTLTDGEKVFSGAHNKLMLASSQAVYTLCLPTQHFRHLLLTHIPTQFMASAAQCYLDFMSAADVLIVPCCY